MIPISLLKNLLAVGFFLALPAMALAQPVLSGVFSDHAVLQRAERVPIWGTASPGEKITVQVGTATADATTADDGKWMAYLNLDKETEGPLELTASGTGGKVTLTDILIGEVWICSGQSNMRFHLSQSTGGDLEAAQANDPRFRYLSIGLKDSGTPLTTMKDKWMICTPQTAGSFSGVGYFTGKTLRQKLNVPVGLIDASWAGVCIEAWMSSRALTSDPDFQPILDRWTKKMADYPGLKSAFDQNQATLLADWEKADEKAKSEGTREPLKPVPPPGPGSLETPSGLFNGELAPVIPYGIKGVLWYQGEQNVGRAYQYRKLLPALIADWRGLWNQGNFPFVVIQLPNVGKPEAQPRSNNFAELREGQALAAANVPNVSLVVTIDAGEEGNIHPKDKKTVGERAGRLIAKDIYHAEIPEEVHGPVFKELKVEGATIRIHFDHAIGLKTRDGQSPTDFAIAGADGRYVWAQATIDGETVVLSGPKIDAPTMVRYDWAGAPHGNLCNADGLPAAPFRTDSLPVSTQEIK